MKPKTIYLKWKDKEEIVERLKKGEVACVPTETVFGIMGAFSQAQRINAIKKSKENKPLACFISERSQLLPLWSKIPSAFEKAIGYWPGPLTLIAGSPLVGVRMPDVPELLDILSKTGPLLATSANLSGENTATEMVGIPVEILEKVDFVIEETIEVCSHKASTILKYEHNKVSVLREGTLKLHQLIKK